MSKREVKLYLEDIKSSIRKIEEYAAKTLLLMSLLIMIW